MSNRNAPPYSFSLISDLFEPNLTNKLLEYFFLLVPQLQLERSQIFPRSSNTPPACTEEGKLATSRAAATPPLSEAAHLCFDVADLLQTGENCCISTLRFPPEAMNYADNWLLTTDTSLKGSGPLWELTLQGEASMYSPSWKWALGV